MTDLTEDTDLPLDSTSELSNLECPICCQYLTSVIKLCQNGHSLCNPCFEKSKICPMCRVNLASGIRNVTLEEIIASTKFSCPNTGCEHTCRLAELKRHRSGCTFKPQKCPLRHYINCLWIASKSAEEVTHHINVAHDKLFVTIDDRFAVDASESTADLPCVRLFQKDEFVYVIVIKIKGRKKDCGKNVVVSWNCGVLSFGATLGPSVCKVTFLHPQNVKDNLELKSKVRQGTLRWDKSSATKYSDPFLISFISGGKIYFKVNIE